MKNSSKLLSTGLIAGGVVFAAGPAGILVGIAALILCVHWTTTGEVRRFAILSGLIGGILFAAMQAVIILRDIRNDVVDAGFGLLFIPSFFMVGMLLFFSTLGAYREVKSQGGTAWYPLAILFLIFGAYFLHWATL